MGANDTGLISRRAAANSLQQITPTQFGMSCLWPASFVAAAIKWVGNKDGKETVKAGDA
jgi:hypothetical protein